MVDSTRRAVNLVSVSAAEDAGYRTAADIAIATSQAAVPYRLVGGLAVSLLHAAYGSPGDTPPRLTADADLGTDDQVITSTGLVTSLGDLGYTRPEGNRFVQGTGEDQRVIDVLVPALGDRLQSNVPWGELTVDAVPGLHLALSTPPVAVSLTVALNSGETLSTELDLPDVIPAMVLKSYAFAGRSAERDLLDLWKLLELAHHLGLGPSSWDPMAAQKRDAVRILHGRVTRTPSLAARIARRRGWSHARIAALAQAHVPPL